MKFKSIPILSLVLGLVLSTSINPLNFGVRIDVGNIDEEFLDTMSSFQKIDSLSGVSGHVPNNYRLERGLERYARTGILPKGIHMSQGNANIVVTTNRAVDIKEFNERMQVKVIVDLGIGYVIQGSIHSPEQLRSIIKIKGVGKVFGDYLIEYDERIATGPGPQIDQFRIREILGVDRVEQELEINGTSVVIGIADSGVDFGLKDLELAMARDVDGYPISFDPSGHGLALTNHTVQAKGNTLPISNIDFDIWISGGLSKFTDYFLQRDLKDLDITGITSSNSGDYKVGILVERGEYTQFFLCVLVDANQPHQYDTLFIDFDTSFALTIKYLLEEESIFLRLLARFILDDYMDFSLVDEKPHSWGDPKGNSEILARDLDDDGFADVSAGALSNTLDYGGLFNTDGEVIRGIRQDGNGFAVMWDDQGHGTSVAGNAVGRGVQPFMIYDDWLTDPIENNTAYNLPGMASGAKAAAVKVLSGGSTLLGWLWLCGFDLNSETGIWEYTGNHKADIINNSFGDSDFELDGYGNSWDLDTLTVDLLSVPGVIHPSYPGTIFIVSGGNGGPGYGTVTSPASSTAAITVAASTSHHPFEDFYGHTNQGIDEVTPWSARGPASLGTPKPDIANIGNFGFSVIPLWAAVGNSSRAYMQFGGTSQAAPLTAGVCALIVEALQQRNGAWSPDRVRYILKSTAKDLGYEAVVQGAGRVDAYRAVQLALGADRSDGNPVFEIYSTHTFANAANLLNRAFTDSFAVNSENNVTFNISTHPGISQTFNDTSFFAGRVQSGGSTYGTIIAQTVSGDQIDEASTLTYELRMEETHSLSPTWDIYNPYKFEDYFSSEFMRQFYTSDLAALHLTYDQEILEFYDEQGWEPLYVFLYDWNDRDQDSIIDYKNQTEALGEVRRIASSQSVANILSMYIGNPGDDFANSPAIMVHDDAFNQTNSWSGVELSLTIQLYKRISWNWFTVTQREINSTEWIITVTIPPATTPGIYQGYIKFTKEQTYQLVPVTVSVVDKITLGPNPLSFGGKTNKPLDVGGIYGSFDWSWRPESGDYRIYNFDLGTSDTKYLVTDIAWEHAGTVLDIWILNPAGAVIDTSDIVFLTDGQFNSTTTRPAGQIIVSPVNETGIYTVVLHCTKFDGHSIPESVTLSMSYLTEDLLKSTVEFSVPDEAALEGPHAMVSVRWEQISSHQLPYIMINTTSISAIEGDKVNTTETIDPEEDTLAGGWFETVGEVAEDYVTREFKKGDQVQVEVGWTAEDEPTDMDIFLWEPGQEQTYDDNLVGSRMATENNPEKATFTARKTGIYTIGIDWFGGSRFVEYYVYTDNTRGVTRTEPGTSATVDTHDMRHNGEFIIRSIARTGTSIQFDDEITVTAENFFPPAVSVTFPNGGERIDRPINITWTANDRNQDEDLHYQVFFSPNNGISWTLLQDKQGYLIVTETHLEQDLSQWIGTDQGLIKVEASDGVFTVEDTSDSIFSIITFVKQFNPIPILLVIPFIVVLVLFLLRRRKK